MRLVEFFRGDRPWWEFGVLLRGLPDMGSHYAESVRSDPVVVEALLAAEDEGEPGRWRPRAEDMSLSVVLLTRLLDRLSELTARQMAEPLPRGAKKPQFPEPFPQPLRLVDLRRAEVDSEYLAELEDEVAQAQARWVAQQQQQSEGG